MRGSHPSMAWYDELLQMVYESNLRMMRQSDEERRKRRELEDRVARWLRLPPAHEFPGVGTYRWACIAPTGHTSRPFIEEYWAEYTRGLVDGLAGRAYAATRQEALVRDAVTDPSGVRVHG